MNRKTILGFSMFINLCIGFSYTWSVFAGPLTEQLNRSLAEVTVAHPIGTLTFTIMSVVGGRIQDRFGPIIAIRAGACLFGGGLILLSFTSTLVWLYICYGMITCGGAGIAYCAVLMNINNFYPERMGSASGYVTACYGLSAVIFSPVAGFFIKTFGLLTAYRILGIFFFSMLSLSSFFIRRAPAVNLEKLRALSNSLTEDKSWDKMIKTRQFYVIFLLMTIGCSAGLMIISQAAVLAENMMGVSAATAALTLSLIAGANASGRIAWGGLSDRIGRYNVLHSIYIISMLALLCLSWIHSGQYVLFVLLTIFIAFCYGGIFGTFPALVTEHFGAKNNSTNFGIILTGVGIGAFLGPMLLAVTMTTTPGNYSFAFYVSAALCFCGFLLTVILKKLK